jgi:hypothetical protein
VLASRHAGARTRGRPRPLLEPPPPPPQATPPRPSLRLLAGWRPVGPAPAPGALAGLLPAGQRGGVLSERLLPGAGVSILELDSETSLDAALASLTGGGAAAGAAPSLGPRARRRARGCRRAAPCHSRSPPKPALFAPPTRLPLPRPTPPGLAYVLRDFPLAEDWRLDGPPTTPEQLFDRIVGPETPPPPALRPLPLRPPAQAAAPPGRRLQADAAAPYTAARAPAEPAPRLPLHLQAGAGLDALRAWAAAEASLSVVVAVVGSGAEGTHPRLGAAAWANPGEAPGDGVDNDGNGRKGAARHQGRVGHGPALSRACHHLGACATTSPNNTPSPSPSHPNSKPPGYPDDAEGWDFGGRCTPAGSSECARCVPGPDASDGSGPGTHAASLAVGSWDNATAAAGVAPGARLMALRVADCHSGQLWAAAAVEAFEYAAARGAAVVVAPWADAGAGLDAPGAGGLLEPRPQTPVALSGADQKRPRSGAAKDGKGGGAGAEAAAAARRRLWEDAVRPLRAAGALLVTADIPAPRAAAGAGASAPLPPLPCALSGASDAVVCAAAAGRGGAAADLRVPGTGLYGAYPGASYAAASGSSPATAVAGGAAALVWSALGARLGGDYAALGPMVKRLLLSAAKAPAASATPAAASAPAAAAAAGQHKAGAGADGHAFSMHAAASSPVPPPPPPRRGAPLRLADAVASASSRRLPFDVAMRPPSGGAVAASQPADSAAVPPGVAVPGATLSWFVNQYGATNAAVLQGVLAKPLPGMAVSTWEYTSKGDTVLTAVLSAQLPVAAAGPGYALRVASADPFALWLGGRRLLLVEDPTGGPAPGEGDGDGGDVDSAAGGPRRWVARVAFDAPGEAAGRGPWRECRGGRDALPCCQLWARPCQPSPPPCLRAPRTIAPPQTPQATTRLPPWSSAWQRPTRAPPLQSTGARQARPASCRCRR